MKELSEIINTISHHTDVSQWDILSSGRHVAVKARAILCHTVKGCYPHLIKKLCANIDKDYDAVSRYARDLDTQIAESSDLKYLVNQIRRELNIPIIKVGQKKKRSHISNTKKLFGFDYTDKEILRRHRSIISANQFMDKYCSHGRQPIDVGMVFTRVKPKRTYNSWYKE